MPSLLSILFTKRIRWNWTRYANASPPTRQVAEERSLLALHSSTLLTALVGAVASLSLLIGALWHVAHGS